LASIYWKPIDAVDELTNVM